MLAFIEWFAVGDGGGGRGQFFYLDGDGGTAVAVGGRGEGAEDAEACGWGEDVARGGGGDGLVEGVGADGGVVVAADEDDGEGVRVGGAGVVPELGGVVLGWGVGAGGSEGVEDGAEVVCV